MARDALLVRMDEKELESFERKYGRKMTPEERKLYSLSAQLLSSDPQPSVSEVEVPAKNLHIMSSKDRKRAKKAA